MAKAIRSIAENVPTPEEQRASAVAQVETAVADKAQAVVELIEMIDLLQEKGLLNFANAFLEQGSGILKIVVDQAGKPEYAGGLKNAIACIQLFSSMDIGTINRLVDSLSQASKSIEEGTVPRVGGIFDLWRYLHDPDVSLGLGLMLALVKAIGQNVRQASSSHRDMSLDSDGTP